MKETYFDDCGNMIFKDQYLEESNAKEPNAAEVINAENPVMKILEKLVENQEKNKKTKCEKGSRKVCFRKLRWEKQMVFNGLKLLKENVKDLISH